MTAAGLGGRRRPAKVGPAALRRAIAGLGVLQIDSVNVFERSHYLPLFSRLGPYDRRLLDSLVGHDGRTRLGEYTEYLAHEAAIIPVADWGLWAWHRARPERPSTQRWAKEHAGLLAEVLGEFRDRGPLRVRDLEHPANVSLGGGWWNKNDVHWAANLLFRRGDLVVVGRERFERIFAPAEVLPPAATVGLDEDEAVTELVRRAAVAQGVATVDDLADYPRLGIAATRAAVARLEAAGDLEPVIVEGWDKPAWLTSGTTLPRRVSAAALLSPFDPLVWHRPRALRTFGFHYRISIYTPAPQREHGYYVLPVLVDDEIVGRVDLKSDRKAGRLRIQHAHVEPAAADRAREHATRIAPVLQDAARWQGLGDIAVAGAGTWAGQIARALS